MKPKGGQITFVNTFFVLELASVNLMLKKETEILWHIVALTSVLFGRMRTWVNKMNWFPLYFIILMWNSCKDSFSVFCKCFHKCILITEELCSLGPGFPSDFGRWCTSVGFLLSTATQLVNFFCLSLSCLLVAGTLMKRTGCAQLLNAWRHAQPTHH